MKVKYLFYPYNNVAYSHKLDIVGYYAAALSYCKQSRRRNKVTVQGMTSLANNNNINLNINTSTLHRLEPESHRLSSHNSSR